MKRALIVGIDDYEVAPLSGCITDAQNITKLISQNEDKTPNFECRALTSNDEQITKASLKEHINNLFKDEADMAFFYFSGHGTSNNLGGYIVTQDAKQYDEGVSMRDILDLANESKIKECILMLDCCFSGKLGSLPAINNNSAVIREGITILTASRPNQIAMEGNSGGLFTSLVCDALRGSAADLLGIVTTASIYAHVEPIFGAWEQRPLFKAHISRPTPIRFCEPQIERQRLRELTNLFPKPTGRHKLDKSYEPKEEPKNHPNEKKFQILQDYCRNGLVRPDGEEHMYFAAINNKSCSLTSQGQFYWHLAKAGKI
ncbi:MAG: caspase family protein [Bdellovibrionales bacterium]|nr:caspase family protein [Bdellovibrionales bacterium]